MNRKGFTLVELLAVIVILGVIGGIATIGVLSTINKSKDKSETIFVDKLSTLIEEYLDLYRGELQESDNTEYTFTKCENKSCTKNYKSKAKELTKEDGITIQDLIAKGIVHPEDLVNPKNKKKCFNDNDDTKPDNTTIRVYRDDEYVYYYYVDLSNTSCELSNDNKIIDTLPDKLRDKVNLS